MMERPEKYPNSPPHVIEIAKEMEGKLQQAAPQLEEAQQVRIATRYAEATHLCNRLAEDGGVLPVSAPEEQAVLEAVQAGQVEAKEKQLGETMWRLGAEAYAREKISGWRLREIGRQIGFLGDKSMQLGMEHEERYNRAKKQAERKQAVGDGHLRTPKLRQDRQAGLTGGLSR